MSDLETKEIKLLKEAYKRHIASYIAESINIKFKVYDNNHSCSLECIHEECKDVVILSSSDVEEVYKMVDDILSNDYNLIIVNSDYLTSPIRLVDISENKSEVKENA